MKGYLIWSLHFLLVFLVLQPKSCPLVMLVVYLDVLKGWDFAFCHGIHHHCSPPFWENMFGTFSKHRWQANPSIGIVHSRFSYPRLILFVSNKSTVLRKFQWTLRTYPRYPQKQYEKIYFISSWLSVWGMLQGYVGVFLEPFIFPLQTNSWKRAFPSPPWRLPCGRIRKMVDPSAITR